MNEEIDIIELFKRIKEGNAPKEIEINGIKYFRNKEDWSNIYCIYQTEDCYAWLDNVDVTLDAKIKILDKSDKPVIEEINYRYFANLLETKESEKRICACLRELGDKINKIIRHINKEEK